MAPKEVKEISFRGRKEKYTSLNRLAKRLNISKLDVSKIRDDMKVTRFLINKEGDVEKINLRKPLILRDFGIKKITNKQLLKNKIYLGETLLTEKIPTDIPIRVNINVKLRLIISDAEEERTTSRAVKIKFNQLENATERIIQEYLASFGLGENDIEIKEEGGVEVSLTSKYSHQQLNFSSKRMQSEEPLNILNTWVNIDLNKGGDCARVYLKKVLKRLSPKLIDELGNEEGVTAYEIIELCKLYNICIYVYDINGKLDSSYIPKIKSKNYPILLFITYNNHCYPIKNRYLKKRKYEDVKIEIIKNGRKKLKYFLNNNILPGDIKMNGRGRVISFIVDGIKYISNLEYEDCLKVLKVYGLEDKIYDNINKNDLFAIIEKMYIKENISSFLPQSNIFVKGGFNYTSSIRITEEIEKEINTIDKNKCYPNALMKLPYLIKVDYRTAVITQKPKSIVKHYLYIAKPQKSSILMPKTEIYSGYHLLYCKKQGLQFELLEEISTTKVDNYYSKMVEDLFNNVDNNIAKQIMVIGIGKMATTEKETIKCVVNGIFNNDEIECQSGFSNQLNDKYHISYELVPGVVNIYNKKPINIQIKDKANQLLYKKMCSLNLTDDNIIQVKTDAISYIGKLPDDLNEKDLNGWKKIPFKKMKKNCSIILDDLISFNNISNDVSVKMGTLVSCYAGVGKTYDIINNLIPQLTKQQIINNEDFIVLTPSHVSLKEYKENNINCDVIQKYCLRNMIPKENIIIVDEFGMCDKSAHDLLFKCSLLSKKIYAYGDFNQLPPPGNDGLKFNSPQYLNLLFGSRKEMIENKRNDFTQEYYDSLINSTVNLKDEVIKYSAKKYDKARVILCWRNSIVKKYNDLMMEKLGLKKYDIGVKLICITNDLHKQDIYNRFTTKIVGHEDGKIKLSTGQLLTKLEISKYFKPAYAMTVYGVQGTSIKHTEDKSAFFYAPEDYKYLNGNKAYTIISRIKTK